MACWGLRALWLRAGLVGGSMVFRGKRLGVDRMRVNRCCFEQFGWRHRYSRPLCAHDFSDGRRKNYGLWDIFRMRIRANRACWRS